jgi:hypothetical protein
MSAPFPSVARRAAHEVVGVPRQSHRNLCERDGTAGPLSLNSRGCLLPLGRVQAVREAVVELTALLVAVREEVNKTYV